MTHPTWCSPCGRYHPLTCTRCVDRARPRAMERLGLLFVLTFLALAFAPGAHANAAQKHPRGVFDLVLVFQHRSWVTPDPSKWSAQTVEILVTDSVRVVPGFSAWDTCKAAGMEAQARFQSPPAVFVDFTCAFKGNRN